MIKLIEYGTKQVRICSTCGCKFSFEKEDIQEERMDGYNQYNEFVRCPQCHENVILQQVR